MGNDIDSVVEIEMEKIISNPHQPRKYFDEESIHELASSIELYGLLQPILVYQDEESYVLIAGERRFRAFKMLHRDTIRAIVADIDIDRLRELALIENIQREDLNPIDLAHAYEELLIGRRLTHQELAQSIHKSRAQITNTLRLLKLIPNAQKHLLDGKITQGHAKVLIPLDAVDQEKIVDVIIERELSVRETERLVQTIKRQASAQCEKKLPVSFRLDAPTKERIIKIFERNQISFKLNRERMVIQLSSPKEVEQFLNFIER